MTVDDFLAQLLKNAPVIVVFVIVVWLSLPQLADRFEIIGKLLRPLSRRWREQAVKTAAAVEVDRQRLLADAQAVAQTTAINSTNAALVTVQRQCDRCVEELHGLRDITGRLIDAVEALMAADTPSARADARAVIRLARQAM